MRTVSLLIFLSLLGSSSYSQVSIAKFPKDKQLYPRNKVSNKGTIAVSGEVNRAEANYSSLSLKLYRNGVIAAVQPQKLKYNKGVAKFSFKTDITAELANYSMELIAIQNGVESSIKKAENIVAGDAFIINGQSNSVANSYRGEAKKFENEFIRSFGTTMHDSTAGNDLNWYIATGDSYSCPGVIGQWGLKTANAIVTDQKIPVAIIAGGVGGTHLLQHMRNDSNPQDLNTIYGRLLFRVKNAGLENSIRAIWWHQGESDGYYRRTADQYKLLWNTLKNHWYKDYQGIEHYYIFQIRQGCNDWQNFALNIMEGQRQLALDSSNVTVISTNGVEQHIDYCHFPFKRGYETFSDRLTPLVLNRFYGKFGNSADVSPDVSSARMIDAKTIELSFVAPTPLSFDPGANNDFKIEDSEIDIIGGSAMGNKLILQLSEAPKANFMLSYFGHAGKGAPYIRTASGNGALSFYNFPVKVN